jgi:hypothetical protein
MSQTNTESIKGSDLKKNWISVGASIKKDEIDLFNRQLDNLHCKTLKDLCSLLISGKLKRISDDEQMQNMNLQIQASGLISTQVGQKFDFWKHIDEQDLLNWLLGKYHPHTAKCYHSYYNRYVDVFFSPTVDIELFKLAKHKRSWILQSIKRFGDFYTNRYGNKEIKMLITRIIERYDLNRDLDQKDRIYLVSPQFVEEKINTVVKMSGEIGFICKLGLFSGLRESEIC